VFPDYGARLRPPVFRFVLFLEDGSECRADRGRIGGRGLEGRSLGRVLDVNGTQHGPTRPKAPGPKRPAELRVDLPRPQLGGLPQSL
jgi:hypothetical protein